MKARSLLAMIGPGILVAATGVGAGDMATAAFTGAGVGLAVLWAVVLGAFLKFVLNEGLTRWQLATGSTLIEGSVKHFGRPLRWLFLAYLVVWSFLVAAALMSAIGVTAHAIFSISGNAQTDKIVYGILHSLLAVVLVKAGGYKLFEKIMSACIGTMFIVVVATAVALQPDVGQVFRGLILPSIPAGGLPWTIALMGGVGGTVTVLCYGYWIREEGRQGAAALSTCRIDLVTAYVMTAIFGLAMVVIGNSLGGVQGSGATLIVNIADSLSGAFGAAGPAAKWAFLIGAWGAMFSSLLGVWQSIPYLFADLWDLGRTADRDLTSTPVDTKARPYQAFLYAIALVPIVGLVAIDFRSIQMTYAVVGALFMPMLAAVLLVMNSRRDWVGRQYTNSWMTRIVLAGILLFFTCTAAFEIYSRLSPDPPPVATQ